MAIRFILAAMGLMLAWGGHAQSVTPQVLASAGDVYVNTQANAILSFTIGEMTMVQTFSNQGFHLTQGFQQPTFELVGLEEESFVELFEVYPNPASDDLHVRYSLRHPGMLNMKIYSMNGVEVVPYFEEKYSNGLREHSFDLRSLAQGMYFLRVEYNAPGKNIEHISHFKINVINP